MGSPAAAAVAAVCLAKGSYSLLSSLPQFPARSLPLRLPLPIEGKHPLAVVATPASPLCRSGLRWAPFLCPNPTLSHCMSHLLLSANCDQLLPDILSLGGLHFSSDRVLANPCYSSRLNSDLSLTSVGHSGGSVISSRLRTASSPHTMEK